jgi:hypothetical protein
MKPKMRLMTPRDIPAILQLGHQQNERDGTNYPVPLLYTPNGLRSQNLPLALVAEAQGQVVQAQLFLRTIELMVFGIDPRATAISSRHIDAAAFCLANEGYDGMHCQVPRQQAGTIEPVMQRMGFKRDDDRLAHFYRDI